MCWTNYIAAHEEALKREIERLGQLYHRQQKSKRMECNESSPTEPPTSSGDQKHKLLYVWVLGTKNNLFLLFLPIFFLFFFLLIVCWVKTQHAKRSVELTILV